MLTEACRSVQQTCCVKFPSLEAKGAGQGVSARFGSEEFKVVSAAGCDGLVLVENDGCVCGLLRD